MTKRTEQQEVDQRGEGILTAQLGRYVVNDFDNDFGIDFAVNLTESGEDSNYKSVQGDHFFVQLKSSTRFDEDSDTVFEDLAVEHIEQYLEQPIPVILAIYDDEQTEIYWCVVQEFVWDTLNDKTPNWRRQQSVRIRIPRSRKITDYDRLETAINRTQNRINRNKNRALSIGEGVAFTPGDFTELERQKENDRLSYRGHTLLLAREQIRSGDEEAAKQSVAEVSQVDYDDKATVKALFMQILMRNLADIEDAVEIAELAEEAESLAKELDMDMNRYIATIYRHLGNLFVILERRNEMLVTDLIQSTDEFDTPGYEVTRDAILYDLIADELRNISAINNSLSEMLDSEEYYAYAICLSPIIDYLSNRRFLNERQRNIDVEKSPDEIDPPESIGSGKNDSEQIHPVVDQAEQLADLIGEKETEFNLRKSIGLYYYNSLNPDKAKNFLTEALNIVEDLDNPSLEEDTKRILNDIEERPNPYDYSSYDTDSDQSHTDTAKMVLEMQGFNIDLDSFPEPEEYDNRADYTLDMMAHQAVLDADPEEYYRHCEHLHVAYSPSPAGKRMGVVSFGSKYLWCQYGSLETGLNLEKTFDRYANTHCEGCSHHCPRSDDWELTETYANEQANDPDFVEAINTFEQSLMPGYSTGTKEE